VGIYRRHVLPHLIDRACGTAELAAWRRGVTAGLHGAVVEIGFGSGHNLAHLPDDVDVVLAVEPADVARRLAQPRIDAATAEVRHIGLDGQAIELDDRSCDAALVTFTLCTLAEPATALAELRRVVKPGGRLHLLEHGLAPDPGVRAWQRRLDPLQRRLADGCHLTRDPVELVTAAGFEVEHVEQRYAGGPRPWTWFTSAVARNPG